MGVSGLWTLLEPVGKRVNIKSLAGKTLAIDASIWIYQFFNSMRDEEGNFVKNGHLLGFFRRICRLMFNRIRPVFVFDGATPTLKRMTIAARRRRREQQAAKVRKTAEKLLMSRLKKHVLAEEKAQRATEKALKAQAAAQARTGKPHGCKRKRGEQHGAGPSTSAANAQEKQPSNSGSQPVAAARRNPNGAPGSVEAQAAHQGPNAEDLGEAAVLLEDDVSLQASGVGLQRAGGAMGSREGSESEESAGEIDLDAMVGEEGELDPAALSQLPTSLQIELMGKYRERQAMLNRSRFQESSRNAQVFSGLQMATYLKQTELRRKVEKLKDEDASQGAQRMPVQPDSLFVLKDHATGGVESKPQGVLRTNGRNIVEWNRRMMNESKRQSQLAAPTLCLQSITQDLPALQTQGFKMASGAATGAGKPAKATVRADEAGNTSHNCPDVSIQTVDTEASCEAVAEGITAEELELAMRAESPSVSEGDECEWEDASEPSPAAAEAAEGGQKQAAQPTRRDVWSRTHGYKFGRKLGEWAGDREDAMAPAAVHPADAAAIESVVATAGAREAATSVQEARKLQKVILQSFEEQAAAEGGGAGLHADRPATPAHKHVRFAVDQPPEAGVDSDAEKGTVNDDKVDDTAAAVSGSAELRSAACKAAVGCEAGAAKGTLLATAGQPAATESIPEPSIESPAARVSRSVMPAGAPVCAAGWGPAEATEAHVEGSDAGDRSCPAPSGAAAKVSGRTIKLPSLKGVLRSRTPAAECAATTSGGAGHCKTRRSEHSTDMNTSVGNCQDMRQGALEDDDFDAGLEWEDAAAADVAAVEDPGEPPRKLHRLQMLPEASAAPLSSPPSAAACEKALQAAPEADQVVSPPPDSTVHTPGKQANHAATDIEQAAVGTEAEHLEERVRVAAAAEEAAAEGLRAQQHVPSAHMALAHAVAQEQQQAEEDLMQVEDGVVVHIMHAAAGSAAGAAAHGASRSAPPAPPHTAEGSRQAAGVQAPPSGVTAEQIKDSTDLEKRIEEVMGDVNNLKRKFRKQSGTEEVPAEMMFKEVQELLQLFGIPYIVAPMEAEAQCAWLNQEGLVDGVVTDDNDVFLFGASHVFRHFFQDQMYCEQYLAHSLQAELGLTRDKLALLALLLGSDYTEGISGIGIVNAMETIATFPSVSELKVFREWLERPDIEAFRAVANSAKKRRAGAAAGNEEEGGNAGAVTAVDRYKASHQAACKSWDVPANFPDQKVLDEYARPHVDSNKASFTFHKPDVDILRGYCLRQFQWTQDQADALLQPVLKQYEDKEKQLRLDAFWTVTHRFAKIRSKRLQAAISTSLGRNLPQEMLMNPEDNVFTGGPARAGANAGNAAATRKRKKAGTGAADSAPTAPSDSNQDMDGHAQAAANSSQQEDECLVHAQDVLADDPDDYGDLGISTGGPYRAQFFY